MQNEGITILLRFFFPDFNIPKNIIKFWHEKYGKENFAINKLTKRYNYGTKKLQLRHIYLKNIS
ncbi:hypothetical protein DMB45_11310 [Sanguibacteroides justesenii]|nr:hypothetical protein DMB45_11310 [Sanguibacteroides justesenii]